MYDGTDLECEPVDVFATKADFVQVNYSDNRWMPPSRIPNVSNSTALHSLYNLLTDEQLQSAPFLPYLSSKYLMREVFLDLSKHCTPINLSQRNPSKNPTAASAALQISLCHLHGWGTARSATSGMHWLTTAAIQGSQAAQRLLLPLSKSLNLEIEAGIKDFIVEALRESYKEANDRLIGWALQEYDKIAYPALLKENRTTYIDGIHRDTRYPYQQLVHAAVKLRPVSDLLRLCQEQGVNQDLGSGMTYLHCASAAGDVEIVRVLTSKLNADVNARTEDGRTPLLLASCNGHADVAAELLERGANPNHRGIDGVAPFHFLARFPSASIKSIAKALVGKDALMDVFTAEREHPLETAVQTEGNFDRQGEVTALKAMMELGADPFKSKNETGQNVDGISPFAIAIMAGDASAVLTMLDFFTEALKVVSLL
jgi:hypothetical protein